MEGTLTGRHLVENDTERKEIGARIETLSAHLFGSHVGHRPENFPGLRDGEIGRGLDVIGGQLGRAGPFGETEVQDFHAALGRDHDVAGLQIAVDHASLVSGGQCARDLKREIDHAFDGGDVAFEKRVERSPLDELHGEEANASVFLDGVKDDDVRVIERGDGARFALEPREARRVGGERGGKHFDRDVATEPGVSRPIDFAHAAGTQGAQNLVVQQSESWAERHAGTRITRMFRPRGGGTAKVERRFLRSGLGHLLLDLLELRRVGAQPGLHR